MRDHRHFHQRSDQFDKRPICFEFNAREKRLLNCKVMIPTNAGELSKVLTLVQIRLAHISDLISTGAYLLA